MRYLYELYGLPSSYYKVSYEDTSLIKVKQEEIRDKISKAPQKGLLIIQGMAAPVVNQLMLDRKVRGIDFLNRCSAAFDVFENPAAPVVVIYNVGAEISVNSKITSLILKNLVKYYSNTSTLLIIETHLTKSEVHANYHIAATNFIKITQKEEQAWI